MLGLFKKDYSDVFDIRFEREQMCFKFNHSGNRNVFPLSLAPFHEEADISLNFLELIDCFISILEKDSDSLSDIETEVFYYWDNIFSYVFHYKLSKEFAQYLKHFKKDYILSGNYFYFLGVQACYYFSEINNKSISTVDKLAGMVAYIDSGSFIGKYSQEERALEMEESILSIISDDFKGSCLAFHNHHILLDSVLEFCNEKVLAFVLEQELEYKINWKSLFENRIISEDFLILFINKFGNGLNASMQRHFFDVKRANYFYYFFMYFYNYSVKVAEAILSSGAVNIQKERDYHLTVNDKIFDIIRMNPKDVELKEIIPILYNLGISTEFYNKNPMGQAVSNGDFELVKILKDIGFNMNEKGNKDELTPNEKVQKIIEKNAVFLQINDLFGNDINEQINLSLNIENS